jgi:hypothetical protein
MKKVLLSIATVLTIAGALVPFGVLPQSAYYYTVLPASLIIFITFRMKK